VFSWDHPHNSAYWAGLQLKSMVY